MKALRCECVTSGRAAGSSTIFSSRLRARPLCGASRQVSRSGLAWQQPQRLEQPLHSQRGSVACNVLRPGETAEQATQRRLRETQEVERRIKTIYSKKDWERELQAAGNKLIVVEVQSDTVCESGLSEEAEVQWKQDPEKLLAPCTKVKHTFARTARECQDVVFLEIQADPSDSESEESELCDVLGVEVMPTVQFWRGGKRLWEHKGVSQMEQDLGEGVLYFGNTAAGGVLASDFVTELGSRADLDAFVEKHSRGEELAVVNVSVQAAAGCIRVYPAVLALARSFKGYAAFGRLIADQSPEAQKVVEDFNVLEVPTFLFFRNGKEVARHVGGSRGDLIGKILEVQATFGVAPPPPPAKAATPRRKIVRRV